MIHIERTPPPPELTQEVVAQKIAEFKSTKNSVWNEPYIKDALAGMSHNKCCYCECDISVESKYLEVEHFHPKGKYPDEVVSWENLLPACKRCNGHKREWDTGRTPIINPTEDCPQDHMLLFRCLRFRSKDQLGKMTIDVLDLNNQDRMVSPRFEISNAQTKKMEEFEEIAQELDTQDSPDVHLSRKLSNGMLELLQNCLPDKAYSAVKTTTVLSDKCYGKIKATMVKLGLWTEEHVSMEQKMMQCKYDVA